MELVINWNRFFVQNENTFPIAVALNTKGIHQNPIRFNFKTLPWMRVPRALVLLLYRRLFMHRTEEFVLLMLNTCSFWLSILIVRSSIYNMSMRALVCRAVSQTFICHELNEPFPTAHTRAIHIHSFSFRSQIHNIHPHPHTSTELNAKKLETRQKSHIADRLLAVRRRVGLGGCRHVWEGEASGNGRWYMLMGNHVIKSRRYHQHGTDKRQF